jgi:DNA-binding transcriptional regulator YdaS (Cro superfamily)
MNIKNYLQKTRTTTADFAHGIGVSPALVYQWMNGIRPIAVQHCLAITASTGGKVGLTELRPKDWHLLWPDATPPKRRKPSTVPP